MFAFLFLSVPVKDNMVSRLLSWLPGLNRSRNSDVGIYGTQYFGKQFKRKINDRNVTLRFGTCKIEVEIELA